MRRLNAANVLLAIRDEGVTDLAGLCRAFGFAADKYESVYVEAILRELKDTGMIEITRAKHYRLTSVWPRFKDAFRIGLRDLARWSDEAMVVQPFLGRAKNVNAPPDVFVLMPFKSSLRPIYDDHIKRVAEGERLSVRRADDLSGPKHIMQDVWNTLAAARIIIADCTGRNVNVFYEIGLAHALGKPVILLAQSERDIPFDLSPVRYLKYQTTSPGLRKLDLQLAAMLREYLSADSARVEPHGLSVKVPEAEA